MSASLVKQSLEIVDSDFKSKGSKGKKKSKTEAFSLLPEQYRFVGKTYTKTGKAQKVGVSVEKKYTVQDAKRKIKSKKQILEENLKKLELIRKNSQIVLDENSTTNIIERAVTRRPIKTKEKKYRKPETAFTEDDFKKFEEEYLNS